ncbi:unnamed protein product, partial [Prorocentrum cordatum]
MSASALIADLTGDADAEGLTVAARSVRRARRLSRSTYWAMERLDIAFHVNTHITTAKSTEFVRQLRGDLTGATAGTTATEQSDGVGTPILQEEKLQDKSEYDTPLAKRAWTGAGIDGPSPSLGEGADGEGLLTVTATPAQAAGGAAGLDAPPPQVEAPAPDANATAGQVREGFGSPAPREQVEEAVLEYIAAFARRPAPLEVKLQETLGHGSEENIEKYFACAPKERLYSGYGDQEMIGKAALDKQIELESIGNPITMRTYPGAGGGGLLLPPVPFFPSLGKSDTEVMTMSGVKVKESSELTHKAEASTSLGLST